MRHLIAALAATCLLLLPLSATQRTYPQENNTSVERNTTQPATLKVRGSGGVQLDLPDIGGGGDEALVLFVVVGVVVVAVLVVYAGTYVYDMATNERRYDYWGDLGWNYTVFYNDTTYAGGSMNGVKLSGGFEDGRLRLGAALEAGSYDFSLESPRENSWIDYSGSYAMAGPHVRFSDNFDKGYLYLELLGGQSSLQEVKTMALARIGVNRSLDRLNFGLHLGAIYVGMEPGEGIARKIDHYETTVGMEAGFRF